MRKPITIALTSMMLLSAVAAGHFVPGRAALAAGETAASAPAGAASGTNALQRILGLDAAERSGKYAAMTFDTSGWQVGKVVSKEPYAVVTGWESSGGTAKLRVWTGLLTRDGDDLLTYWDELWLDRTGKVTNDVTEDEAIIDGYFAAKSQDVFRVKLYLGEAPWADIPTDAEAKERGRAAVSDKTTFNLYGIVFKDSDVVAEENSAEVSQEANIPDRVPAFAKRKAKAETALPADIENHWAREYAADLLQSGIVEGYEDHTIRPDVNLTRGQFVAMLVRAAGLEAEAGEAKGYADVKGHWSEPYVAAAQRANMLSGEPATLEFQPDAKLTRVEMVELIAKAMAAFRVTAPQAEFSFSDIGPLPDASRKALQAVVGAEIVSGYPDGTFKPNGLLTRAEAFKVISVLMNS